MAAWMRPWLSRASTSGDPMSGGLIAPSAVSPAPAMRPTDQWQVGPRAGERYGSSAGALALAASATFAVLLALYAALGLYLTNAPMQDMPDHITRAHIIADLLFNHGREFGDHFLLRPSFSPYIGTDLLLASLDRLLGLAWATRLTVAASMVLLPLAVWFVVRRQGGGRVAASTGGVLALYVATDSMFVMGFASFLFSTASALFAYGWWCDAARTGSRRAYLWFVLLLLVSYALHLSALIFILGLAGLSALLSVLRGELSIRWAAVLLLPPLLLLVLQLALSPGTNVHGAISWGTWYSKLRWFAFQACRFRLSTDVPILAAFAAAAAFPIALRWPRRSSSPGGQQLLITLALALLYLVTPYEIGIVTYLDMRALHYGALFLVCAGVLCAQHRPNVQWTQLAAAALVAVVNLVYLAAWMLPQNRMLGEYRLLARRIAPGAMVLPIDTRLPQQGTHYYYDPFRHAGAYVTLETHALTPDLFAGDRQPHLSYFRYRARPYSPQEVWYVMPAHLKAARVDWPRVQRDYRYLMVTVPWDAGKIGVPYTIVAENQAAALLEVRAGQR